MSVHSSAYDSLQRVLSTGRGGWNAHSPTSPSTRRPIPDFQFDSASPVSLHEKEKTSKRVVSPSLSWWKMKEVLEVEYKHRGRARRLLQGDRALVVAAIEATSQRRGNVKLDVFSDGFLLENQDGSFNWVTLNGFRLEGSRLISPSSASNPTPEHLSLLPSPTLSSTLSLLSSLLAPPPVAEHLPTPRRVAPTPDSALTVCECCSTVRFSTLQRIHHCRDVEYGRGICGRCSRFRVVGDGKKERICKDCFSRAGGVEKG